MSKRRRLSILLFLMFSVQIGWSQITVPFDSISELKKQTQVNAESALKISDGRIIVVYTYLGCKPCLALAKHLNKEVRKGNIEANRIVYFNVLYFDSTNVKKFVWKENYPSPYFIASSDVELEGAYPRIAAYSKDGTREWSISGFGGETKRKIRYYLNPE